MQVTVKEAKFLKEGSTQKGIWRLFKFITTDDKEYTTFDTKADGLPPGSVIEMGDITTKADGKMTVKDFQIVSQPTAPAGTAGTGYKGNGESPDVRASIEAQVAVKSVTDLICADKDVPKAIRTAYDKWLLAKLNGTPEATISKSSEAPVTKIESSEPFPHVGALLSWCAENGVDRSAFLNIVGVKEAEISKVNIENAHQLVKDFLASRDDDDKGDLPF